jgi:hypothetical protein
MMNTKNGERRKARDIEARAVVVTLTKSVKARVKVIGAKVVVVAAMINLIR